MFGAVYIGRCDITFVLSLLMFIYLFVYLFMYFYSRIYLYIYLYIGGVFPCEGWGKL